MRIDVNPEALKELKALARTVIKEKIDCEGKYLPKSIYEMVGRDLCEYLIFAMLLALETRGGRK